MFTLDDFENNTYQGEFSMQSDDDEFDFDEVLAKLDTHMEKESSYMKFFRIGKRQVELNENHPIFFRGGPTQKQLKSDICNSCQKNDIKDVVFCQFCATANCQPCMTKERAFPRGKLDDQGKKPRGKICIICDRKFLIK